nr:hypothetical protein GCM10017611_31390 [Rhodococcus wratislaviensis]
MSLPGYAHHLRVGDVTGALPVTRGSGGRTGAVTSAGCSALLGGLGDFVVPRLIPTVRAMTPSSHPGRTLGGPAETHPLTVQFSLRATTTVKKYAAITRCFLLPREDLRPAPVPMS